MMNPGSVMGKGGTLCPTVFWTSLEMFILTLQIFLTWVTDGLRTLTVLFKSPENVESVM